MKDDKVLNEIIHKVITRIEEDEQLKGRAILEEGFMDSVKKSWESAKGKLAKLGRVQKGGKFLGRDDREKKALKQMQDILNKSGMDLLKVFVQGFEKKYPGFPNIKDRAKFIEAIGNPKDGTTGAAQDGIYAFYLSIVEMTKQKPTSKSYLDPVAANAVIKGLRQYVEKLIDYDLSQVYQYMESEQSDKEVIGEADPSVDPTTDADGPLKGDQTTGTEKVLKSKKLPMVLGIVGTMIGSLGWLLSTDWFKSLFDTEEVTEKVVQKAMGNAQVIKGDGILRFLGRTSGVDVATMGGVKEALSKISPTGNWKDGITKLQEVMADAPKIGLSKAELAKTLQYALENSPADANHGKIFSAVNPDFPKMVKAATGKDISSFYSGGAKMGEAFGVNLGAVMTIFKMVNIVVKTTTASGLAALGILSTPLAIIGATGAIAGAGLAWLRKKGQVKSRFADLNNLLKALLYVKEDNVVLGEENKSDDQKQQESGNAGNAQGEGIQFTKKDMQLYDAIKQFFKVVYNNKKLHSPSQTPVTNSKTDQSSNVERVAFILKSFKANNGDEKPSTTFSGTVNKYLKYLDDPKTKDLFIKHVNKNLPKDLRGTTFDVNKSKISYADFERIVNGFNPPNTQTENMLKSMIRKILLREAAFTNLKIEPKEVRETFLNRNTGDKGVFLGKDTVEIYEQMISRLQHIVFLIAEVNASLKSKIDSGEATALDKQFVKNLNEVLAATKNIKGGFRSLYAVDDVSNRMEVAGLAMHIKNFFKILYKDKAWKDMDLYSLINKYKLHEQVMGRLDENTQDERNNIAKFLPKIFGGLYIIYAYMRSQMNRPAENDAKKKAQQNAMKPNAFAETPDQRTARKQGEKSARTGKNQQNINNQGIANQQQDEEI